MIKHTGERYPFFNGGGGNRCRELLGLETFPTLLEQALFALVLPDLNHVVLPTPPPFLRIHGHLVPVPANLGPRTWP